MTVLLREAIGDRLRHTRTTQHRTLREVSRSARVSLGYLSEVERGRKEASSELLAAICDALDLPMADLLHTVASDMSALAAVANAPTADDAVKSREHADAPYEGGRLLSESVGDKLSDIRLQPVLTHRLPTLTPPRGEVVVAA
ncbi:helix-turn-helix domain-containing protein [Kutzneria buriramensis]|uniref:Transcriptional regulator with XRE-family HTH domain n=1 Tax=Kutzneria buriramensis TaxID=1045776 RepID=A0A3E0I0A4_9PSEU|nr:helix-turn-helix transcriptional regulator [Kutzneria buriramensis]REH52149.1 transcriptional regulator with XRE-family HTH domain [Kutzneria buriramensis]